MKRNKIPRPFSISSTYPSGRFQEVCSEPGSREHYAEEYIHLHIPVVLLQSLLHGPWFNPELGFYCLCKLSTCSYRFPIQGLFLSHTQYSLDSLRIQHNPDHSNTVTEDTLPRINPVCSSSLFLIFRLSYTCICS